MTLIRNYVFPQVWRLSLFLNSLISLLRCCSYIVAFARKIQHMFDHDSWMTSLLYSFSYGAKIHTASFRRFNHQGL